MSEAKRDQNFVPTLIGVLNTDGETPTLIKASSDHYLEVDDNSTGSDLSGDVARRDKNHVPVALAVSEDDGVTPVELYVNSDGKLLVDSN
jgi:hypothetical protein